MRTISIRDDLEQTVLQYVRALPDIFTSYDIASVQLVSNDCDGVAYAADIVFVESEDYEVVIGDVLVGTDLILDIDIYSEEDELLLTELAD